MNMIEIASALAPEIQSNHALIDADRRLPPVCCKRDRP